MKSVTRKIAMGIALEAVEVADRLALAEVAEFLGLEIDGEEVAQHLGRPVILHFPAPARHQQLVAMGRREGRSNA